MTREKFGILVGPRTIPVTRAMRTAVLQPTAKPSHVGSRVLRKGLGNLCTIFIKIMRVFHTPYATQMLANVKYGC